MSLVNLLFPHSSELNNFLGNSFVHTASVTDDSLKDDLAAKFLKKGDAILKKAEEVIPNQQRQVILYHNILLLLIVIFLLQKKKFSNLNNSYKSEFNSEYKNAIVDLNVLAGVFSEAVKCLQCGATGLNLSCEENCSGGAVELDILCDFCSYSYKCCSSKKCKAEIGKPSTYEINTRFVYA
ncbi:hypothetical protein TNIN_403531 [Trichonephila inaurata madagascariensis]|uniref:Uncharacterized protein n=1 Tax=Trichonephila inaurata madagascariensis TaxID=2747483 RepID=A0A8X6XAE8_9ARAC|nr:hypothetical protein TNIN_403531 [Trichonephila inaurata madagascariensis]